LLRGEFRAAAMSALVLVAWFGAKQVNEVGSAAHLRYRLEDSIALLRSADRENLPIVVTDTHTFFELSHYAPPEIASNLVYLADPAFARQILGIGSIERGMLEEVGPWFHMHVVPFEQFVKSKTPFLIYGYLNRNTPDLSWVVPALKERRFRVEFQSNIDDK